MKKIKAYKISNDGLSNGLVEIDADNLGSYFKSGIFDITDRKLGGEDKYYSCIVDDEGRFFEDNQITCVYVDDVMHNRINYHNCLVGDIYITKVSHKTGNLINLTNNDISVIKRSLVFAEGNPPRELLMYDF